MTELFNQIYLNKNLSKLYRELVLLKSLKTLNDEFVFSQNSFIFHCIIKTGKTLQEFKMAYICWISYLSVLAEVLSLRGVNMMWKNWDAEPRGKHRLRGWPVISWVLSWNRCRLTIPNDPLWAWRGLGKRRQILCSEPLLMRCADQGC